MYQSNNFSPSKKFIARNRCFDCDLVLKKRRGNTREEEDL